MLLSYESKYVRLVLRLYFNLAFLVFALLGNQICVRNAKHRLLQAGNVPLTLMTGWLSSFDPATAIWKLRRLPCGWLGVLMILCAILSFTSDLAVSTWVRTVSVPTRCVFNQGMVISPTKVSTFDVIPNNGIPYQVAAQAQLTSQVNGGKAGIYWKVNRALNFRADDEDVIGSWTCQDLKQDQTYSPEEAAQDIVDDLQNKDLLFHGTSLHDVSSWGNGSSGHLVAWTSSSGEPGSQFSVRASVDLSPHLQNDKVMRSFECNMHAQQVEWVLSITHPIATLKQWTPCFQGSMYDGTGTPAVANVSDTLEWLLNSMVMVGAGANNLLNHAPAANDTQGCLGTETTVPGVVIAVFGIVTGILVVLPLWLLALMARMQRWGPEEKDEVKRMPDDLFGWMAQAAREVTVGVGRRQDGAAQEKIKGKDLLQWEYARNGDGRSPGMRKKTAEDTAGVEGGEGGIIMRESSGGYQEVVQPHDQSMRRKSPDVGMQEVGSHAAWRPYRAEGESRTNLLVQ
jgi:hypothetical protein